MTARTQTQPDEIGHLLTPDEVSAMLRLPKSWIYSNTERGTLPFRVIRIGGGKGRLRFPERDVYEYLHRVSVPSSY